MSGSGHAGSSGGASSLRPRGQRASRSRASRGASSLDNAREHSASPAPAIPKEEARNYGGRLLSGDYICNCDWFEDGDSCRVMTCGWASMLAHFRRLPQFLRDFLLHQSSFGSFLWIPAIHGHYNFFRALAERWSFEMHTFHFPYGEMTILPEH